MIRPREKRLSGDDNSLMRDVKDYEEDVEKQLLSDKVEMNQLLNDKTNTTLPLPSN